MSRVQFIKLQKKRIYFEIIQTVKTLKTITLHFKQEEFNQFVMKQRNNFTIV